MKVIFSLLCFSALLVGCAGQQFQPSQNTTVVAVDGKDKLEIYDAARQWFSSYFVSGESVIDYENREVGTIIGKGMGQFGSDPFGLIDYRAHYTLKVETKNNKFRVTSEVLKHSNRDPDRIYDVGYLSPERVKQGEAHVQNVIENLESYVESNSGAEASDW